MDENEERMNKLMHRQIYGCIDDRIDCCMEE